jgi:hypothetical protein
MPIPDRYLIALLVGILTEAAAGTGRCGRYSRPIAPVINIVLMFGLVMGGLRQVVNHLPYNAVL